MHFERINQKKKKKKKKKKKNRQKEFQTFAVCLPVIQMEEGKILAGSDISMVTGSPTQVRGLKPVGLFSNVQP